MNKNDHNAELLGCLEAAVTEKTPKLAGYVMKKWKKISGFRHNMAISKHNYLQKQTAREQVTNMLELMRQELEAINEAQNGPNPMDFSVTDNEDPNRECDRAEQEKRKLVEELEKTKTEYEKALASKNREVSLEIERIKKRHGRTNVQGKSGSY